MLAAAYLDLIALDDGDLRGSSGYVAYAAILELMSRSVPALSARLHAPAAAKPFTVSGLLDGASDRRHVGQVAVGSRFRIRLTALEPEVADWVAWMGAGGVASGLLNLGRTRFEIGSPAPAPQEAEGIAISSYDALLEQAGELPSGRGASVTMAFHSPTAFRNGHVNVVFPIPELVFGGLARRWDAFAPITIREALDVTNEGGSDPILVARHDIETEMLDFGSRGRQVGFRGTCTFQVKTGCATAQMLAVLAEFARFAGVGYRTSWGMGQALRVAEGAA